MEQALELVLRIAAAGSLTAACVYLGWSIHQGMLAPTVVWKYLLMVIALKAAFRWLLTIVSADTILGWRIFDVDDTATIAQWQPDINQALYTMMGVAVILLIYGHISGVKAMRRHRGES
jgi:hypothetical protein